MITAVCTVAVTCLQGNITRNVAASRVHLSELHSQEMAGKILAIDRCKLLAWGLPYPAGF